MMKLHLKLLSRFSIAGACLLTHLVVHSAGVDDPQVRFENRTQEAGLMYYTPTFSVVVSDVDNDGVDDLFVGHHGFPPMLYLNRDVHFIPQPEALPLDNRADRHGYTFVDFDNDGDKDFAFAGGGADGIGEGMRNEIYKNLLIETGNLEFVDVSSDSDIADAQGRTRHLLPLANPTGDKVDLYSTGLHKGRPGSKNIYAANHSTASKIVFKMDTESSLSQTIESDGKDLFFDYDRDGFTDFLSIGQGQALLYRNNAGTFARQFSVLDRILGGISQTWIHYTGTKSATLDRILGVISKTLSPYTETSSATLDRITGVISGVAADLNNDGFPDLYLGGANGQTNSDHVVSNGKEIHISIANQQGDTIDHVTFRTASPRIKTNFVEHIPSLGKTLTDPSNIFIGKDRQHPKARNFQTGKLRAAGEPADTANPGLYLWYQKQGDLWHLLYRHDAQHLLGAKGIIYGEGIELMEQLQLESFPVRETRDYIVMNQGGKGWELINLDTLKHDAWTNHLTAADFNNDGFVDVAGVQTREDGELNGDPFIVLNHGGQNFSRQVILQNTEDDIFRADLIVHGFFNDDGLPDLFYTNGFGLLPSHVGPYQFWLNATDTRNGYLLLELEGTTSNRDAIGAQIELYDADDKLLGYRELGSNFGRGQNTHKVHFGLGDAKGPFSLRIRWPGAHAWQSLPVTENNLHHIRQE